MIDNPDSPRRSIAPRTSRAVSSHALGYQPGLRPTAPEVLIPDSWAPRTPPPPPASRRLRNWVRTHALSLAIAAGLIAIATFLVGTNITHYPAFADDEGTYVAEAWAVITRGQLSQYTYWYDHPPFGWIQLGLLTSVFGGLVKGASAVATARSLMLFPTAATTALLYGLGRRLGMTRGFAVLAVVSLIAGPLGITSLREVYLENWAMPWLLAAFLLAVSPGAKLWAFAASGVCFAAAVLSKETMLLFLPGLLVAILQKSDRRTRAFCLTAFFLAFLLMGGVYPLFAILRGELLPGKGHVSLEQAVVFQLVTRQATGSVFNAHSVARQVVDGWLNIDPWLLGLGLGAVPFAVFVRRLRPIAVALGLAVIIAVHGGYLPVPFDIGLLPLCALLPAGLLDTLWQAGRRSGRIRRPHLAWVPRASRVTAAAVTAGLVTLIAPQWIKGDRLALTSNVTFAEYQAEHWIEKHISHHARLIIDDTMYVDLIHAGWEPRYGAVWFSKLGFSSNLDPAIVEHLPQGWKEFDYVVDSPPIQHSIANDPSGYAQVEDAIRHSRTVATFGYGTGRIYVRKITVPSSDRAVRPGARAASRSNANSRTTTKTATAVRTP